jgi:hypothetical protein
MKFALFCVQQLKITKEIRRQNNTKLNGVSYFTELFYKVKPHLFKLQGKCDGIKAIVATNTVVTTVASSNNGEVHSIQH